MIHSWWIPELGGKADAIPGYTNQTWFKISEPGVYKGQCAELCGEDHADMRARVRAVTPRSTRRTSSGPRGRHQGGPEALADAAPPREGEEDAE